MNKEIFKSLKSSSLAPFVPIDVYYTDYKEVISDATESDKSELRGLSIPKYNFFDAPIEISPRPLSKIHNIKDIIQ